MNKKLLKIVLLIFVIGIWGKIGYDFIMYKRQEVVLPTIVAQESVSALTEESFEYELNLDYRDPFLGKYNDPQPPKKRTYKPRSRKITQPKKEEPPKPKVNVKWPKIQYIGNIKHQSANKESITLKVNGQESFMLLEQEFQGVTLKELYADSIILIYKEQEKTILR